MTQLAHLREKPQSLPPVVQDLLHALFAAFLELEAARHGSVAMLRALPLSAVKAKVDAAKPEELGEVNLGLQNLATWLRTTLEHREGLAVLHGFSESKGPTEVKILSKIGVDKHPALAWVPDLA